MAKIGSESRGETGSKGRDVSDGTYLERTKGLEGQPQPVGGSTLPPILDGGQVALFDKGWLPEGLFPELDELREEHHRILDESVTPSSSELKEGYAAEDTARQEALNAGEEPPPVTGSAERQDAIKDAEAQSRAKVARLAAFVERAIEVIKEKGGENPEFPDEPGLKLSEWRQTFVSSRSEVEVEVEAAKAALAKAERRAAYIDQIETWLNRTVKPRGGRYIEAPEFGAGLTEAEREEFRLAKRDIEAEMEAVA